MDTGPGLYFNNSDVDSRRLQEAFFSSVSSGELPVLPQKTPRKINFWLLAATLALIVTGGTYALNTYELMIIPKSTGPNRSLRLLEDSNVASFAFLGDLSQSAKINKTFLSLPLDIEKKTGLEINFKTPVNLNNHDILLLLRNDESPLMISAVIKDSFFYSNIKQPERVVIETSGKKSFNKVKIGLNTGTDSKVNPSQVRQVKLLFEPYSAAGQKINIPVDYYQNQMIIVKDIALIKKEGR